VGGDGSLSCPVQVPARFLLGSGLGGGSWVLTPTGAGQNPARQAAMKAGVPKEVPASSVNMLCGSGLKTVALGCQAIKCGDASLVVAGGQESMSQVRERAGWRRGHGRELAER
jgi:acetyl-CoA acetyltransferase